MINNSLIEEFECNECFFTIVNDCGMEKTKEIENKRCPRCRVGIFVQKKGIK